MIAICINNRGYKDHLDIGRAYKVVKLYQDIDDGYERVVVEFRYGTGDFKADRFIIKE